MKVKMILFLFLLATVSFGQVITLAEARATTGGETVTVEGIITTPSWSTGYTSYQFQDETAGLLLFYYGQYVPLAMGDLVNVTGYIELYNGLLEIIALDAASITVVSSGNDLPASQPLTLTALLNDPEEFESELITIYNVSATGGTWPVGSSATLQISDDGGNTEIDMRIDSDTDIDDNPEPVWPVMLTGVLSQYDGSAPYDEGYQIMPRAMTDVADPPTGVSTFAEARADSGGTHTVRGFITTPPFAFSRTDVGFQDATGGLNLFVYSDYMATLEVGDFVEATGLIMDYNGKREIDCGDTSNITILYKGGTVPPPMTMTIAEILADPETTEGMLVKVLNATYSGDWPTASGSFDLVDPTDTIAVYVDSDMPISGMTAPVGAFNLTGWQGQYYSYQIMPRYESDIETFENQAPVIVNVTYSPQPVYDMDDVTITAEVTDDGTFAATLVYDVGAGDISVTMTYTTGDLYTATIPGQSAGTMVDYMVSVDDGSLVTDSDALSYLVLAAAGQSIPIRSVQYSLTGPSPLDGQVVTITGIVTAEFWGSSSNRYLYVQDSTAAWSGIYVFEYNGWDEFDFNAASGIVHTIAEGDSVSLTGTVTEFYGVTELTDVTAATIYGEGSVPEPIVVTPGQVKTGGSDQEAYEGVLVKVENVTVVEEASSYGEWLVTDGTDTLMVDDTWDYYFWPKVGDVLTEIVGVMDYSYNEARLQPRLARDVVENDFCRIQRIQQVLYSDLLKTGRIGSDGTIDHESDLSYMNINPGVDTTFVTIEGIVTMPSELGYAGAGIKVIYQDEHGGPWSGILSYDPDSSAFPVLWEGDTVVVSGYIAEYQTDHGNMTELFATDVPNVVGYGTGEHRVGIPDPVTVATGDLRWPETAEQWGNAFIQINDLTVTDVRTSNTNEGMFSVTDGSGDVWIDHDSWVIYDWWELVGSPTVGTHIDSIYGWMYHHFGTYSDSGISTYKVVPLYLEDISLPTVSVGDDAYQPMKFALHQNYPNPFNPTTQIQFEVAKAGKTTMVVYNVLGRQVRTLVNSELPTGKFTVVWNGKNNTGRMLSTGIYFVRMISDDFVSVKKMTLLR